MALTNKAVWQEKRGQKGATYTTIVARTPDEIDAFFLAQNTPPEIHEEVQKFLTQCSNEMKESGRNNWLQGIYIYQEDALVNPQGETYAAYVFLVWAAPKVQNQQEFNMRMVADSLTLPIIDGQITSVVNTDTLH